MDRDEHDVDLSIDQTLRDAILAEPLDTAALDARIRHELARESNKSKIRRGKWVAAVSIAAMLAIAIGGYRIVANRNATICNDAIRDHRIEVAEHAQRRWLSDPAAVLSLATSRGLPAAPVNAIAPEGFRFEHGKLCRLGGQVFLHLVYTDGAQEVSVYLRRRESGSSVAINQGNVAVENGKGVVAVAVTAGSNIDAAALARRAAMMSS